MFRLNNTRLSWNSTTISLDGVPLGEGVLAVDYTQTRERKVVYGSRKDGRNVGVTSGRYATSGSIKLLRETAFKVLAQLSIKGLGSYGDPLSGFTLVIQSMELEPGAIPLNVVLSNCLVKEVKHSLVEGVEELVSEITLNEGFEVSENGLVLFSRVRSIG